MRQIFLILAVIFIGFFTSCAKKDNAKEPSITVDPESLTVAANAGSSTINVTMNGSL